MCLLWQDNLSLSELSGQLPGIKTLAIDAAGENAQSVFETLQPDLLVCGSQTYRSAFAGAGLGRVYAPWDTDVKASFLQSGARACPCRGRPLSSFERRGDRRLVFRGVMRARSGCRCSWRTIARRNRIGSSSGCISWLWRRCSPCWKRSVEKGPSRAIQNTSVFPLRDFFKAYGFTTNALQRARATLAKRFPSGRPEFQPAPDDRQRGLLDRYMRAWEGSDLDKFVALLREDAVYSMPPWRDWYRGREAIRAFFGWAWRSYGGFRLIPTSANLQPAFAVYSRAKTGSEWRAHSIQLLALQDDSVAALTVFKDPKLFDPFALRAVL